MDRMQRSYAAVWIQTVTKYTVQACKTAKCAPAFCNCNKHTISSYRNHKKKKKKEVISPYSHTDKFLAFYTTNEIYVGIKGKFCFMLIVGIGT